MSAESTPFGAMGLKCEPCRVRIPHGPQDTCPQCGGPLDVEYDLEAVRNRIDPSRIRERPRRMLDRWRELLPPLPADTAISLGEGGTPLVSADRLARALGLRCVWLKLEGCNPTGSFKDRQVSVAVATAVTFGARGVATVSSGNAGVSVATYATRAGLPSWVWIGPTTPTAKIEQILLAGAHVRRFTDVLRYRESYRRLGSLAREWGLTPLVTARQVNPYITEGGKTIAHEVIEQLNWRVPDWVAVPVGGGGLLGGMWKGFTELQTLGWTAGRPRLLAGQFDTCQSIIEAAAGRSDPTRFRGLDADWAGHAVMASRGCAIPLNEQHIAVAQARLAETEGLYMEPQGVMGLAGLMNAAVTGQIEARATVVVILTGHGLKDREGAARLAERFATVRLRTVTALEDSAAEVAVAVP